MEERKIFYVGWDVRGGLASYDERVPFPLRHCRVSAGSMTSVGTMGAVTDACESARV